MECFIQTITNLIPVLKNICLTFWSSLDAYHHILKLKKSYLKGESCKRRTEFPMGTSGTKFDYNFFQIQPNSLRMYTLERISKIDYGLYPIYSHVYTRSFLSRSTILDTINFILNT